MEDMDVIDGKTSEELSTEAVALGVRVLKAQNDMRGHPDWKKYRICSNGREFEIYRHKFLWLWTSLTRRDFCDNITTRFNTLKDVYEKIENDIEKRKNKSSYWEVVEEIG